MNQRLFANTKIQVSEIGLGCWRLGGADWGDLDDQRALDILNAAADVYGTGRSETRSSLPPLSPELHKKLSEFYQREVMRHIRGPY